MYIFVHCNIPLFVHSYSIINNFLDSNPNNSSYDDMSHKELRHQLLKKDIEIARLKKGYMVKEGGTEKKEFITFSKKNTK